MQSYVSPLYNHMSPELSEFVEIFASSRRETALIYTFDTKYLPQDTTSQDTSARLTVTKAL